MRKVVLWMFLLSLFCLMPCKCWAYTLTLNKSGLIRLREFQVEAIKGKMTAVASDGRVTGEEIKTVLILFSGFKLFDAIFLNVYEDDVPCENTLKEYLGRVETIFNGGIRGYGMRRVDHQNQIWRAFSYYVDQSIEIVELGWNMNIKLIWFWLISSIVVISFWLVLYKKEPNTAVDLASICTTFPLYTGVIVFFLG